MSDEAVYVQVKGLEQILKALKSQPPVVKVGILGDAHREGGGTNAEVGAAHEFGTSTIPMRSFLRVPITEGLQKEMDKSHLSDPETIKKVIKDGTIVEWMTQISVCAEACVSDAFDTGGNGKWPAWKSSSYENNTGQLLVDTQQLRESVTSKVK